MKKHETEHNKEEKPRTSACKIEYKMTPVQVADADPDLNARRSQSPKDRNGNSLKKKS